MQLAEIARWSARYGERKCDCGRETRRIRIANMYLGKEICGGRRSGKRDMQCAVGLPRASCRECDSGVVDTSLTSYARFYAGFLTYANKRAAYHPRGRQRTCPSGRNTATALHSNATFPSQSFGDCSTMVQCLLESNVTRLIIPRGEMLRHEMGNSNSELVLILIQSLRASTSYFIYTILKPNFPGRMGFFVPSK